MFDADRVAKVQALYAGAGTEGERAAAQAALERMGVNVAQLQAPPPQYTPPVIVARPPLVLDHAVVYDVETLPNVFTFIFEGLFSDLTGTFEISEFRDDREALFQWFAYWRDNNIPMVGFNNVGFDYPVIHFIYSNPYCTFEEICDFAQSIIRSFNRFEHVVWESDRFAPQIDLFKIHHFDNKAKSTSLKALQVSMRSDNVMEMPLPFDRPLTRHEIETVLIPYNRHDVRETKKFAHISMDAIRFRLDLMSTLHGDVLNFNDTKIGAKILEQRLGDDLCYARDPATNRRVPRQTIRHEVRLNDIIFPYVRFTHPEFQRVLAWMRQQTLRADDLEIEEGGAVSVKTKGVFTGVSARVGGVDFHFGTGGIHASVEAQRLQSDDEHVIVDIDVASLYPNIAIQNRLYPEHLGERFVEEYARLPEDRKMWQAKKGKKCSEANTMKLASNGTYGNSNSKFSVFFDSKFTMTITINGQLLLCMLAEWLLFVPGLQIIQANTDGITYRIPRAMAPAAEGIRKMWERETRLVLEEATYSRMLIRDVNNYIAVPMSGPPKIKGAYWYPAKFPDDISNSQPPAWHKDFSAVVVIKAAVDHMVNGTDIAQFIYAHRDPFDFMCRAKVDRSSKLYIGDQETQRITRYYIADRGGPLRKIMPAKGPIGEYCRKNGISDAEYHAIRSTVPAGTHDPRIHTKNKSQYAIRETGIEKGFLVAECNVASRFDFANVNYKWYIEQAKKLVIA